jgi:hypothetical protein
MERGAPSLPVIAAKCLPHPKEMADAGKVRADSRIVSAEDGRDGGE